MDLANWSKKAPSLSENRWWPGGRRSTGRSPRSVDVKLGVEGWRLLLLLHLGNGGNWRRWSQTRTGGGRRWWGR
jgi:hypothetical protein